MNRVDLRKHRYVEYHASDQGEVVTYDGPVEPDLRGFVNVTWIYETDGSVTHLIRKPTPKP